MGRFDCVEARQQLTINAKRPAPSGRLFFVCEDRTRAAVPNDQDADARPGLQHVFIRNRLAVAGAPHSALEAYSAEKRHPAWVRV